MGGRSQEWRKACMLVCKPVCASCVHPAQARSRWVGNSWVGAKEPRCRCPDQWGRGHLCYTSQGMKLWRSPRDAKDQMSSSQSDWVVLPCPAVETTSASTETQATNLKGLLGEESRWSLVGLHGPFPQAWGLSHGRGPRFQFLPALVPQFHFYSVKESLRGSQRH